MSGQIDIGQSAETGAAAGVEAFFQSILGQFEQTSAGQSLTGALDQYAIRRYLPWIVILGLGIWLVARETS